MDIRKLFIEMCVAMSVLYVLCGDRFLPNPYSSGSREARAEVNEFLVSLLPREKSTDFDSDEEQYQIYRGGSDQFTL